MWYSDIFHLKASQTCIRVYDKKGLIWSCDDLSSCTNLLIQKQILDKDVNCYERNLRLSPGKVLVRTQSRIGLNILVASPDNILTNLNNLLKYLETRSLGAPPGPDF